MNDINIRQNEEISIKLISSFRQKYTDVKRIAFAQLCLVLFASVFLTVIGALLKSVTIMQLFDSSPIDITKYIALYCLFITFFDSVLLSKWLDEGKELASKLQEKFDCFVYSMQWNSVLCGDEPSIETIHKLNKKYTSNEKNNLNDLRDWYDTKVSSVSLNRGVLLSQRMNLNWDKNLRKSVNKRVTIFAFLWFLALFALAFFNELTVNSFVIDVLVPFVPVFVFSHRLFKDNKTSIDNLTRYKAQLIQVWEHEKTNPESGSVPSELRAIQNEIYLHRKSNRPVSDKFYWKTKNSNEDEARCTIEQLISQLQ